jgi:hypothetical protein
MTTIGQIVLAGEITLHHRYNYNIPTAHPFGTFSAPLTVQSRSGVFAPHVSVGEPLVMDSLHLPTATTSSNMQVSEPRAWSIGGFTLDVESMLIAGPDSGRAVVNQLSLSGHAFDPGDYPGVPLQETQFTAPAFRVDSFLLDVTGPISMTLTVGY